MHLDSDGNNKQQFDKFGNEIGGTKTRVELVYGNHKLEIDKKISVSAHSSLTFHKETMYDYELTEGNVRSLWKSFLYMNRKKDGFINPNDILHFIDERYYSIIAPYLERLFDIINKEDPDRANFAEFLPALVSFNMFSKDEIVIFVFNMFDKDRNDEISKKDVFMHLVMMRDKQSVYASNLLRAVEIKGIDRADKMSKQDFLEMCKSIPFLLFPAFRLQQNLQEKFGGARFWRKQKVKLEKKEQERKMMAEAQKLLERSKKKKQ